MPNVNIIFAGWRCCVLLPIPFSHRPALSARVYWLGLSICPFSGWSHGPVPSRVWRQFIFVQLCGVVRDWQASSNAGNGIHFEKDIVWPETGQKFRCTLFDRGNYALTWRQGILAPTPCQMSWGLIGHTFKLCGISFYGLQCEARQQFNNNSCPRNNFDRYRIWKYFPPWTQQT